MSSILKEQSQKTAPPVKEKAPSRTLSYIELEFVKIAKELAKQLRAGKQKRSLTRLDGLLYELNDGQWWWDEYEKEFQDLCQDVNNNYQRSVK